MLGPGVIAAYLVGAPGSGKSALIAALVAGLDVAWDRRPFAHGVYFAPGSEEPLGVQIGGPHPTFPGTDRLSMAVQPAAIEWVTRRPSPIIIGEGDRLATVGFLRALGEAAERFDLVWLDTPPEVAEVRRRDRGGGQNAQWVRGRVTKVARLVSTLPHVRLDGSSPLAEVAAEARRRVPAYGGLDVAHAVG